MLVHVKNEKEFNDLIASGKVLVDFFATWCGPCKMIAPILEELGDDPSFDVAIVKVDVDELPEIAAKFGIQAIPTLIYFEDGKSLNKNMGFMRKDQILKFCNK